MTVVAQGDAVVDGGWSVAVPPPDMVDVGPGDRTGAGWAAATAIPGVDGAPLGFGPVPGGTANVEDLRSNHDDAADGGVATDAADGLG